MANFIQQLGGRRLETLFRTNTDGLPTARRWLLGLAKLLDQFAGDGRVQR